jgi:hypothetical protein
MGIGNPYNLIRFTVAAVGGRDQKIHSTTQTTCQICVPILLYNFTSNGWIVGQQELMGILRHSPTAGMNHPRQRTTMPRFHRKGQHHTVGLPVYHNCRVTPLTRKDLDTFGKSSCIVRWQPRLLHLLLVAPLRPPLLLLHCLLLRLLTWLS